MARATSSLPVPDSPWISTVAVVGATIADLFDHLAKRRAAADDAVRRVAPDVLAKVGVFEFQLLLQLFDFASAPARGRSRSPRGRQTCAARRMCAVARIAVEHAQHAQNLAAKTSGWPPKLPMRS